MKIFHGTEREISCADPGIFFGGVEARLSENSLDKVFFSPQLILQFTGGGGGSNGLITEKTILMSNENAPPTKMTRYLYNDITFYFCNYNVCPIVL